MGYDKVEYEKHPIISFIFAMGFIYLICLVIPTIMFIIFGIFLNFEYPYKVFPLIIQMGSLIYGIFLVWYFCQIGNMICQNS